MPISSFANRMTSFQALPDHVEEVGDLDEDQSKFPDSIDKYKSASCRLFLVLCSLYALIELFLQPFNKS